MAKKTEDFYFDSFVRGIDAACDAAYLVRNVLASYDAGQLPERLKELHAIEHRGDEVKHALVEEVSRAFITPLERDDIMTLSQAVDQVTDSVEDILIRLYITGVRRLRSDTADLAELLIKCVEATRQMLQEFRNFKKSKKLAEYIILINHIEEEADALYMSCMRQLHAGVQDLFQIVVGREIYDFFEKCFDACEDVADIVESITIGNT